MPMLSSGEKPATNCEDCQAACCRANEIMSLTLEETVFMLQGGIKLATVAQPKDYDREEVPYPVAYKRDDEGNIQFLLNPDKEYEPLLAGLGRYLLLNDCGYLETDESGWEHCGAYENRPGVCRDFKVGSDKCFTMQEVQVQIRNPSN